MNQRMFTSVGVLLVAGLFLLLNSAFIVRQTEQALVLEFGEYVTTHNKPGLKFKIPFIQNVVFFDKRVIEFNAEPKEVSASDRKRLIIDAFVRYRITDPLQFYRSTQDESRMNSRLNTILDSSLRQVMGGVPLTDVLSEKRDAVRQAILEAVRRQVSGQANKNGKTSFGIEVVDVRIMRSDLPESNSTSIYKAMRANFEKEAKKYRAEGAEEAQRITAGADKDRTILLAEARRKADVLRGEGDAEAGKIFAAAYGKDEEFFRFYRSLQAYRTTLAKENTTMLLSPQSEFFKYFEKDGGRQP